MTNFEEACKMSAEKWVASFPDEVEAHKFSQKHIDAINEIIYPNPAVKVKKLSKKTVRFIIIAAVLLALATTAIASPAFRQFTLKDFSNHSEYRVGDIKKAKAVSSLKLNYIPDEFKMVDKYESEDWFNYSYKMGEQKFEVEKLNLRSTIGFDTENSVKEELQINGADAAYYRTADNWGTVIFNNGEYIYYIGGNISKEELVKIAQNVNALLGPITAHAETVVRRKGEEKKKYYFSLVTSISRKGTSNPYVYDTTTYGAWSENNSIGGKKYPASGDDYILQACPSGFTRRSDSLSIIYNHNKKAESGKDYSSLAGDRNYIAYSVSDDPSGINQMSSVRLYASSKGNRANYYRTINSYYVHTWKSLSIKVSASASANSDKKYGVSLSITPSVSEKSWQVYSYVSFQL